MARIIPSENGVLKKAYYTLRDQLMIGRAKDNNIQLKDELVSSKHALISQEPDEHGLMHFYLKDLDSTHGCFLNKKRISCHQLKHNDVIRIGSQQFVFFDHKEYIINESTEKASR